MTCEVEYLLSLNSELKNRINRFALSHVDADYQPFLYGEGNVSVNPEYLLDTEGMVRQVYGDDHQPDPEFDGKSKRDRSQSKRKTPKSKRKRTKSKRSKKTKKSKKPKDKKKPEVHSEL